MTTGRQRVIRMTQAAQNRIHRYASSANVIPHSEPKAPARFEIERGADVIGWSRGSSPYDRPKLVRGDYSYIEDLRTGNRHHVVKVNGVPYLVENVVSVDLLFIGAMLMEMYAKDVYGEKVA